MYIPNQIVKLTLYIFFYCSLGCYFHEFTVYGWCGIRKVLRLPITYIWIYTRILNKLMIQPNKLHVSCIFPEMLDFALPYNLNENLDCGQQTLDRDARPYHNQIDNHLFV